MRVSKLTKAGKPAISEAQFLRQVIELGHAYRWKIAHFRPAKTKCRDCKGQGCSSCGFTGFSWRTAVSADGAGFPDLIMVRKGKIIFFELKADKGKLTDAQYGWFWALNAKEQFCYVWRPSDIDEIEKILKG